MIALHSKPSRTRWPMLGVIVLLGIVGPLLVPGLTWWFALFVSICGVVGFMFMGFGTHAVICIQISRHPASKRLLVWIGIFTFYFGLVGALVSPIQGMISLFDHEPDYMDAAMRIMSAAPAAGVAWGASEALTDSRLAV